MSSTDTSGSAVVADPAAVIASVVSGDNAGSPAAPNGATEADKGSGNGAADPFAGLETGSREWVGKSGVKDVATLVKNAMNAESLIGKSVQVPDANATPEDWNKFYGRVGRPEKSDGYEFALPEGTPENMPYDGNFAASFKPIAHQLGLSAKQAAGVHDYYVGQAANHFKGVEEQSAARLTNSTAELEKAWGESGSMAFTANVEDANRALKNNPKLEASLKSVGLLGELDGKTVVTDPEVAMFLAKSGKLYREDELVQGQGGGSLGDIPFAAGPGKGNQTVQMQMIANNLEGAKRLIGQAGHKLSDWNIKET